MIDEKIYTIPLRKEFISIPIYRKTKKAIIGVKNYIKKHLKVEEVKIGKHLNEFIWKKGATNPPPRVKVKAKKENNIGYVELPEFDFPKKKEEEKTSIKDKIIGKKEPETEKAKEEKEEEKLLEQGKAIKKKSKRIREETKTITKEKEEKLREEKIITETKKGKTKL